MPVGQLSSYWTGSFVTASNNHQYLLINHVMYIGTGSSYLATTHISVYDINTKSFSQNVYSEFTTGPFAWSTSSSSSAPLLRRSASLNGIDALSADNVTQLHSWSRAPNNTFDLVVDATSAVLLNGGMGQFELMGAACVEWGLTKGRTSGNITLAGGAVVAVDPARSFTWYDRQFSVPGSGSSTGGNYTWFSLILPGTPIRASIWAVDTATTKRRLATFRFDNGTHVTKTFKFTPLADGMYTSKNTNITYHTKHRLTFPDGDYINVAATSLDQEQYNTTSAAGIAYEGFSVMDVSLFGRHAVGYGTTEITTVKASA
ncbi:hypothetical protein DFJ73DRAFT_632582 [Zopfochytrium polystomum]|nr:hypothetical protein DFJ73DRAFT_632582 [Zopfochytrium polystomum]